MAVVVRETVVAGAVVAEDAAVVAGVCADTMAAAQKMKARDRFFTRVPDLGEIRAF